MASVSLLQGKDSAKYAYEDSNKEKTSKPRKRGQPCITIKVLRPSITKVHIIPPNSGTLELWKVLTWPSEGIWPTPYQCSLLGLLFLLCRYCFERSKTVWLTSDFSASSCIIVNNLLNALPFFIYFFFFENNALTFLKQKINTKQETKVPVLA